LKIGIMSDSHDNLPKIQAALAVFERQQTGLVINAGDLVAPFAAKELKKTQSKLVAVFGNNDGERLGLARILGDDIHEAPYQLKINELKILVCHEPYALAALKQSGWYSAIIYGHTHEIDVQPGASLIINPGECGGWVNQRSTVAVWDTDRGTVEIVDI